MTPRNGDPQICGSYHYGSYGNTIWDGAQVLFPGPWWLGHIGFMADTATIPGAAHLGGANGSWWRTDLEMVNQGEDDETVVKLSFRENGEDGSDPPGILADLAPGDPIQLTDVVSSSFGVSASGTINVDPADRALHISARTYDDQLEGTVGQNIPVLHDVDALRCFDHAYIPGLASSPTRDDGFRTNIGLISICAEPTTASRHQHVLTGRGAPRSRRLVRRSG